MQVKMKTTRRESPDGITGYEYQKDIAYDVPDPLGRKMIEAGHADEVDPNTGEVIKSKPHEPVGGVDRKPGKGSK